MREFPGALVSDIVGVVWLQLQGCLSTKWLEQLDCQETQLPGHSYSVPWLTIFNSLTTWYQAQAGAIEQGSIYFFFPQNPVCSCRNGKGESTALVYTCQVSGDTHRTLVLRDTPCLTVTEVSGPQTTMPALWWQGCGYSSHCWLASLLPESPFVISRSPHVSCAWPSPPFWVAFLWLTSQFISKNEAASWILRAAEVAVRYGGLAA